MKVFLQILINALVILMVQGDDTGPAPTCFDQGSKEAVCVAFCKPADNDSAYLAARPLSAVG